MNMVKTVISCSVLQIVGVIFLRSALTVSLYGWFEGLLLSRLSALRKHRESNTALNHNHYN